LVYLDQKLYSKKIQEETRLFVGNVTVPVGRRAFFDGGNKIKISCSNFRRKTKTEADVNMWITDAKNLNSTGTGTQKVRDL